VLAVLSLKDRLILDLDMTDTLRRSELFGLRWRDFITTSACSLCVKRYIEGNSATGAKNWMPWATTVIRIRSNDRSSCTILSMFTWGMTGSSLRLGGDSLRQGSLGKLHLFMCIRTFCGAQASSTTSKGITSFFIAHTSSCAKPAPSSEFVYPHFIRRSLQVAASPCWLAEMSSPRVASILFSPKREL
jgi:hypothetical protein